MIKFRIPKKIKKKQNKILSLKDCDLEFQTRVYTLKENEINDYCERNRINKNYLYSFDLKYEEEWEYQQYFTSTKDKPLLVAVIPLLQDQSLKRGNNFFIGYNKEDSNYYIWGISQGLIVSIDENFPVTYKSRASAEDSIHVISSIKGMDDVSIIDVNISDLSIEQIKGYAFKAVKKGVGEVTFYIASFVLFQMALGYLAWKTNLGVF